jgi:predicted Zn-dependent protease
MVKPCSVPLTYSIGTFDEKFGISRKDLVADIQFAESKWEKAVNKDLFTYVAGNPAIASDIQINLIYDYRQITTDKLDDLSDTIDQTRAKYNTLKSRYSSLKASYETKAAALKKLIAAYDSSRKKTREMYQEVTSAQEDLNSVVREINSIVPELNSLAKKLNNTVDTYNSVGASTGREFDEGNYVRDSSGAAINVYQFSSKEKLIRLLEHELGHAIGLDHVENPKAIMYRLNESASEELTSDDIKALSDLCRL